MIKVKFYENVEDGLLKFAVIAAKSDNRWVYCKHRDRETYEIPGGHREPEESIIETAKRELYEETGAVDYILKQICPYSVIQYDNTSDYQEETFGMLYFADINRFDRLPDFEIEKVILFDCMPDNLTYPLIQPLLYEKTNQFLYDNIFKS
jgi:8-oxo-dGTP diphosphatase